MIFLVDELIIVGGSKCSVDLIEMFRFSCSEGKDDQSNRGW